MIEKILFGTITKGIGNAYASVVLGSIETIAKTFISKKIMTRFILDMIEWAITSRTKTKKDDELIAEVRKMLTEAGEI